jgi:hypothetical protein
LNKDQNDIDKENYNEDNIINNNNNNNNDLLERYLEKDVQRKQFYDNLFLSSENNINF